MKTIKQLEDEAVERFDKLYEDLTGWRIQQDENSFEIGQLIRQEIRKACEEVLEEVREEDGTFSPDSHLSSEDGDYYLYDVIQANNSRNQRLETAIKKLKE